MNQCSDSKSVVSSQDVFAGMIGECSAMKELKAQMMRVAATDANVLITGENGTGKDVVAHALHQLSGRARKPFVNIDLGCIPENLFESELSDTRRGRLRMPGMRRKDELKRRMAELSFWMRLEI